MLYSLFNIDYTNLVESQYVLSNYDSYLNNKETKLFSGEKLIGDYFDLDLKHYIKLECNVDQNGFRRQPLSKYLLKKAKESRVFIKETSVTGDYKCFWKVRNIGVVAENKTNIFGQTDIKKSAYSKKEETSFNGPHYVECYIVKNNMLLTELKCI
ncbi:hypothetical protein SH1V18_34490 [Vallitalea longa]|uniref:Adenylyl/Guanylyl and SMODS C-terminal sensor domain-containing protein n=1 Tax=Vallitalea longa TaxID=2936439 RepID=A0A9W5YFG5_9FIRM|nr:hypothetical protein [Vallitalea longa]GKX30969.1 hypothetical protein SH1V18_34490 [Vallitalea longa]